MRRITDRRLIDGMIKLQMRDVPLSSKRPGLNYGLR
jgi:hypothetical protein